MIEEGYAHAYDGGTKDMNLEALREIRRAHGTLVQYIMDKHDIPFIGDFYTKAEVDQMIAAALDEARAIDEKSMAEHNFKATIISMVLGFICLALFLDGTLRLLGIIPPFMDIDISIVDKIAEKVETEVLPLINQAKGYIPRL